VATYEHCGACGGLGEDSWTNYRCWVCGGEGLVKVTITARKTHTCSHCEEFIAIGAEYVRYTYGPWLGGNSKKVNSYALHEGCVDGFHRRPATEVSGDDCEEWPF
jgi:hypothetical protein